MLSLSNAPAFFLARTKHGDGTSLHAWTDLRSSRVLDQRLPNFDLALYG